MKLWNWLSGKKSVIGGVCSLTVTFLQANDVINSQTAIYLASVSALILGVGITHKAFKPKK